MAKRKNPKDATIRNVRASKKRDNDLLVRIMELEERMTNLERKFSFSPERKK